MARETPCLTDAHRLLMHGHQRPPPIMLPRQTQIVPPNRHTPIRTRITDRPNHTSTSRHKHKIDVSRLRKYPVRAQTHLSKTVSLNQNPTMTILILAMMTFSLLHWVWRKVIWVGRSKPTRIWVHHWTLKRASYPLKMMQILPSVTYPRQTSQ